jgi:hypothetical protein
MIRLSHSNPIRSYAASSLPCPRADAPLSRMGDLMTASLR